MTRHDPRFDQQLTDSTQAITKLVIMAVGGQGGGVLTSWIEAMCRAQGRAVQATSVAGVAQRTGATIYYLEIAPKGVTAPVFCLAPAAGDVDILIAAELMEAGRAIQRGFVTPDRTVLIASDHRALAVSEKMVPGDGIAKGDEVRAAAEIAAQRCLVADMEHLAVAQGSVISASLFGALAGSGALPFERAAFEQAIRASGKGVDASLAAFAAGFDAVVQPADPPRIEEPKATEPKALGPTAQMSTWAGLQARVAALPDPVQDIAQRGLRKVVTFQDVAYGDTYLTHVEDFAARDEATHGFDLTCAAAKHVANAMAYDDVIRVADRKTQAARFARITTQMGRGAGQGLHLTEYFHPRAEEIVGLLPAGWGARLAGSPKWMARIQRWFSKGRRIRTDRIRGFVPLYLVAGLRRWRRGTYRHRQEQAHLSAWLDAVRDIHSVDYALAVEMVAHRRLIKGYSDTHARGLTKFDKVMLGSTWVSGRSDSADWAKRLRDAALQDESQEALDGALATIRSFLPNETP